MYTRARGLTTVVGALLLSGFLNPAANAAPLDIPPPDLSELGTGHGGLFNFGGNGGILGFGGNGGIVNFGGNGGVGNFGGDGGAGNFGGEGGIGNLNGGCGGILGFGGSGSLFGEDTGSGFGCSLPEASPPPTAQPFNPGSNPGGSVQFGSPTTQFSGVYGENVPITVYKALNAMSPTGQPSGVPGDPYLLWAPANTVVYIGSNCNVVTYPIGTTATYGTGFLYITCV